MNTLRWKRILQIAGFGLLFAAGIYARTHVSKVTSDLQHFVIPWYDYIQANGIAALGDAFSNYTPPYTYLLALMTLTASFLPKVTAIKLISILADVINAFLIFKIVRLKYPAGLAPFWAAGIFFCLPTVFVNSAVWGQADAIYTVFLLLSLYCFLRDKPFWGMVAFSIAFTFKLQAVFFAPFLVVLLFRKQVKFWHFFLVPALYVLLCLPSILLGRSLADVLTIYLDQSDTFQWLSGNAPNLYIFIANRYYQTGLVIGLVIAFLGTCAWMAATILRNKTFGREGLVLAALASVALLPFLLPKMHERYFYPADVFSLAAAFYLPELWFVPLAYQFISGMAYTVYMSRAPVGNVEAAAIINTILVAFLIWKQVKQSP